jgi:hypothetical protein
MSERGVRFFTREVSAEIVSYAVWSKFQIAVIRDPFAVRSEGVRHVELFRAVNSSNPATPTRTGSGRNRTV